MRDTIRKFTRSERGAVALMFGLLLVPLMGMTGVAIDYARNSQVRAAAAAAADAAALEAVKTPGTLAQRRAAAERIFNANMAPYASGATLTASFDPVMEGRVEKSFRVSVSGDIPTTLAKVLGFNNLGFSVAAEAVNPKGELRDVVFVLDTTDSMEGTPLSQLKSAVNQLLDEFERNQLAPEQTRVAVVPFGQYVNVGMGYRNASWINVPPDYQTPIRNECRMVNRQTGTTNCRNVFIPTVPATPAYTCYRDGRARTCPGSPAQPSRTEQQCDAVYDPVPVQECNQVGGDWVRWSGCVGSRDWPLETQDGSYANRIPGLLGVDCGSPITPLTDSISTVRSQVNGLVTMGETYLPSGLIWGWRLISPREPFAGRTATSGERVRRFMIMVTDGMNTRSPTYPEHNGNSTADANTITRTVCQNIAADTETGAQVFTVAFEVTDPVVKELLRNCAQMNGGDFYDAANADQLVAALQNIGRTMWALRLSK